MPTSCAIRKVFQGVATRQQMFRMFDRHVQRPNRWDSDDSHLFTGEWFEIGEAEHDYMFEILPPLWIRGDMFAMREFLTGSVTSVFFTLSIDGRTRHFHAYCDLAQSGSLEQTRASIIDRESRPVKAMTREERIEHIWSDTADRYRGYSDETCPQYLPGRRLVVMYGLPTGKTLKLLDDLTDTEIAIKLPVHLRYLPEPIAA